MTRRLLAVLVVGTLAAVFATVASVWRDVVRILTADPETWRG